MKKTSLGRGLTELLSGVNVNAVPSNAAASKVEDAQFLAIDQLQPGQYQPRKAFVPEALEELSHSIRVHGVLQPLLVRKLPSGCYEIIAGERRWRAAQTAGLVQIPVFIREVSDEAAMAMALIENIQREDLNVIEQATALKRLMDEFGMTHEAMASALGKSRASISNTLRLLQLTATVKEMLENNELEMGHARALLTLTPEQQIALAREIKARQLSVRETEYKIRLKTQKPKPGVSKKIDPDILKLQSKLSDQLGTSVVIQHAAEGKGKLLIHYYSLDELDGILEKMMVTHE